MKKWFAKHVKMINEKILEFKTHFAGKDMQDYISMVVLWYATQRRLAQILVRMLRFQN